ncbi:FAD-binding protein [Alicyclobacillaceae bacterium I2511]|nr:FAD-binding protein [Alicyclobacillaceae bacterium I2511]
MSPFQPSILEDLKNLLSPSQVFGSESVRNQHSHDESYHTPVLPDGVVYAESTADVVKLVQYANLHHIPLVPFGSGSGLEGQVVPVHGGISLDLTHMNRVLEVLPQDFLVRVQPGVTRTQLNEVLKPQGLFFPVDPGADASLGGMAATNASGTTTVRYGAMKDNVRSLQVVLANGSVIHTSSLASKSSSGYNLTPLFVGSEGTLGVFTELWLQVYGIPEATTAARAAFPDIESCVQAATDIIGAGISVVRMELVDAPFFPYLNAYKQTHYPEAPTLFLEFQGNAKSVQVDLEITQEIVQEGGCQAFEFYTTAEQRAQLWETRHNAAYAFKHAHVGFEHMSTDVCVPISKLPLAVTRAKQLLVQTGVIGAIVGHVGDGNFHVSMAVKPEDPEDMAKAYRFNEKLVYYALELNGTCTGEHGVGLGKRKYQAKEHGSALAVMQTIKQALDPSDLLNPGKLVDPED